MTDLIKRLLSSFHPLLFCDYWWENKLVPIAHPQLLLHYPDCFLIYQAKLKKLQVLLSQLEGGAVWGGGEGVWGAEDSLHLQVTSVNHQYWSNTVDIDRYSEDPCWDSMGVLGLTSRMSRDTKNKQEFFMMGTGGRKESVNTHQMYVGGSIQGWAGLFIYTYL